MWYNFVLQALEKNNDINELPVASYRVTSYANESCSNSEGPILRKESFIEMISEKSWRVL